MRAEQPVPKADSLTRGDRRRFAAAGVLLIVLLFLLRVLTEAAAPPAETEADRALRRLLTARLPAGEVDFSDGSMNFDISGAPSPYQVRAWRDNRAAKLAREPHVQALAGKGAAFVPALHRALTSLPLEHPAVERLVYLLSEEGTKDSVPVLIGLLRAADIKMEAHDLMERQNLKAMTTAALWKLTGREMVGKPDQWVDWWVAVSPDFVPARERAGRKVERATVTVIIRRLGDDRPLERERLICLGPGVVPHLLAELPRVTAARRYHLAYALDELGEAEKLTVAVRRDYFTRRLRETRRYTDLGWEKALARAIRSQTFANFCRTAVAVDRAYPQPGHEPMWGAMKSGNELAAIKLGEIDDAVPVLVAALKDPDKGVRLVAVEIAGRIGMDTPMLPEDLIQALYRAWRAEKDDWMRSETAVSFARFGTGFVANTLVEGLKSQKDEILTDSAYCIDFNPLCDIRKNPKARDGMIELLSHPNDRARRIAAWHLAHTQNPSRANAQCPSAAIPTSSRARRLSSACSCPHGASSGNTLLR